MQITIKPTEAFFMAGDVMVRAWTGTNEAGEAIIALVSLVVGQNEGLEMPRLVSVPPPDREAAEGWARKIQSGAVDWEADDGG